MKRKRRTEITIETREVLHVRGGTLRGSPACPICGPATQLVPAEEAARRTRVSLRAIVRRIENGHAHFVETPEGHLLVCLRSLGKV